MFEAPIGIHDVLFQHLRQRTAPDVERGEREHVDARVVVFVGAAGLVARPRGPLARLVARPVGPVGLAPERAFQSLVWRSRWSHVMVRLCGVSNEIQKIRRAEAVGFVAGWNRVVEPESAEHTRAPCR